MSGSQRYAHIKWPEVPTLQRFIGLSESIWSEPGPVCVKDFLLNKHLQEQDKHAIARPERLIATDSRPRNVSTCLAGGDGTENFVIEGDMAWLLVEKLQCIGWGRGSVGVDDG